MIVDSKDSRPPLQWFALRVRSRFDRVAAVHLRDRGYEEFAPSYQSVSKWSDRKKAVERFLFPGYVFCRLNPANRQSAITVPGVVNIVGFGASGPQAIPDDEIERVRKMVDSGLLLMPWPFLEAGHSVLIEQGPLAGIEGILETVKGKDRLVVSITLLKRSVSAEIDRDWIRPINSPNSSQPSTRPETAG